MRSQGEGLGAPEKIHFSRRDQVLISVHRREFVRTNPEECAKLPRQPHFSIYLSCQFTSSPWGAILWGFSSLWHDICMAAIGLQRRVWERGCTCYGRGFSARF